MLCNHHRVGVARFRSDPLAARHAHSTKSLEICNIRRNGPLFNGLRIAMNKRQPDDSYSEPEAQRRFQDALKAGLNTPPKPLKDKPKIRKPKKGASTRRP
jgi:hypothetical protein